MTGAEDEARNTPVVPDWQPTLVGARVLLRPVVRGDFEALYAAASDPLIWSQHPESTRHRRDVFGRFFDGALECGGGLVAEDPASGRVIGSSRFYEWDAGAGTVVVGYTFLERARWGTGTNAEMKALMLGHAFRWARAVLFHVGPGNRRSRIALERVGARLVSGGEDPAAERLVYRIDRPA